ncbi:MULTISPECIES: hypothetical protein [Kitasatospora]
MEEEPFGGHGEQRPGPEEQGGEPACLLALLCPSCDAVPEPAGSARCWRCGADLRRRAEPAEGAAPGT